METTRMPIWVTESRELLMQRYRPAGMLQRMGGLITDGAAIVCLVFIPTLLATWWFGPEAWQVCEFEGSSEVCRTSPESVEYSRRVFYLLASVWWVVYSFAVANGGSWGKKAVEMRVIDATTGEQISFARALIRTALAVVSFAAFGLGFAVALTNKERRTAHDLITGTRVISY